MRDAVSGLRVNAERFRNNFESLASVGATPGGGVHRPTFSQAHFQARQWFIEQAERAGLEARVDGAGNHSARLQCGLPGSRTLLLGSHLDSVPYGGRFDGALGVLCALEVLQTVKETGLSLAVDLEAVDLTDEEGTYGNFLGSRGLAGKLRAEDLENPSGGQEAFENALALAGLSRSGLLSAGRDPNSIAGYLEVHVEQGPRLAQAGADIGIVTDIVSTCRYRLKFIGRADHSGTTPMENRRDASQGASAFALAARETVLQTFKDCVVNVGNMRFEPGAFNVVPAAVHVSLEFRSLDPQQLQRLERSLFRQAREQAERFQLALQVERLKATAPTPMSSEVQQVIKEAAELLGLRSLSLPSGAGHDAQSFADLCPTGMLFVPSVGGYSHSSKEFTRWHDCVNGANVLLHATLKMSGVMRAVL